MCNSKRLAGLPFFVHATKAENFLCASHPINCSILLQHLHSRGFARSVSETPLQRFHSIIIGVYLRFKGWLRADAKLNDLCLTQTREVFVRVITN